MWTTPHCDNQDHPRLTVQNITFLDGNSKAETKYDGGGMIWVRGGRFKVVNARFFRGTCADSGPDLGGAAIRVLDQYEDLPVYVVNSTFGGAVDTAQRLLQRRWHQQHRCLWTIINSLFSHNEAVGKGGNPAQSGTPGGGSGGAIYNDGNTMTLSLCGTRIEHNDVVQHGSAIFFVTNDHTGNIRIESSVITSNTGGGGGGGQDDCAQLLSIRSATEALGYRWVRIFEATNADEEPILFAHIEISATHTGRSLAAACEVLGRLARDSGIEDLDGFDVGALDNSPLQATLASLRRQVVTRASTEHGATLGQGSEDVSRET